MTVYIETYGCQMNEYDTEIVRAILTRKGYTLTDDIDLADVVLLNTCSVRENANRKIVNRVHDIRHRETDRPLTIGLLGCMVTDLKDQLLDLPLDLLAGPDSYKHLPRLIRDAQHKKACNFELSRTETYSELYPSRQSHINAWLAVMRGCDNFCAYCVVPYTRGRERSRSVASVVEETRRLADEGFRQVTLLGQNVNSYSADGHDFAALLEAVSNVEGIERIRFTSPHPKDFPERLIAQVAENPKVCRQIHLPLQAGNDHILSLMKRTYTQQRYLDLVEAIRTRIPDVVLSTDIIVGFPTETDTQFQDTVHVVKTVQFDSAFMFKYSVREGTLAAKRYADDVHPETKTERITYLNELQQQISLEKNRAHIGDVQYVMIERQGTKKSADDLQGRNEGNKVVILPPNPSLTPGQIFRAEIVDATVHTLKARLVV